MQSHSLKRFHQNRKARLVGRGGKRGKTSGRGGKGQTARAGAKVRPEIRDMIKRLPKLRGRGKNIFQSIQTKPQVVNLADLESAFTVATEIIPKILVEKGLVVMCKGRVPAVKILGDGEVTKKFTISGCLISASARAKVEKAGGKVS